MMGCAVAEVQLKFIVRDVDRHGNVRVYFWRKGFPKVRMREPMGSAEFLARYQELLAGNVPMKLGSDRLAPGTWRWLAEEYMRSSRFRGLDMETQKLRRGVLSGTYSEPIFPGAGETFGNMPVHKFGAKAVRVLRDRKAEKYPTAGNQRVKCIGYVFAWAIDEEYRGVTNNPARDVSRARTARGGHHTWTPAEIEQFERRHPIGTKARLAFAIFRYTGVRKSDAVRLGKQHVRDGWLRFRQYKNRNRHPVDAAIPLLPELARIIAASQTGDLTFLVTERGVPFTINGFGNKFRDWCDEAGLPHCSAHGIRKADATLAAEAGATGHQLQSMFGWKSLKEAELYTRDAERKKLAAVGMPLLAGAETGTKGSHRKRR